MGSITPPSRTQTSPILPRIAEAPRPPDEVTALGEDAQFQRRWLGGIRPLDEYFFLQIALGTTPEAIADELGSQPPLRRPTVVCLDATSATNVDQISNWIERFDGVLSDSTQNRERGGEDNGEEGLEFYEPRRIILAPSLLVDRLRNDWIHYADVAILPVDSQSVDGYCIYNEYVRQTFVAAFTAPESKFQRPESGALQNISDALSPSEFKEWDNRIRQVEEWGGNADLVS